MTRSTIGLMLILLFTVASTACAEDKKDPTDDIVVTGKAISKEELDNAQPMVSFGKEEFAAILGGKKPVCKYGTVGAEFDGSTFSSGGETFTVEQLLEKVHQLRSAQKISCFRVQARNYDKAAYKQLERAFVDQQMSLFWDEIK
jgi:hypothetical protein